MKIMEKSPDLFIYPEGNVTDECFNRSFDIIIAFINSHVE